MRKLAVFFSSGFFLSHPVYHLTANRTRIWRGCGLVGTAEGVLFWWLAGRWAGWDFWSLAVFLVVLTLASVPVAQAAEGYYGKKDDSRIVIDEFVGFSWAGAWFAPDIGWLLAAAVLFRFFDVFKPLGIRKLEALPGGWGCIMDDAAGGLAAAFLLAAGARMLR